MSTVANPPFACLVPQEGSEQLKGAQALKPLTAGQMIIAHGTYEDGSETGPGVFLILRQTGAKEYVLSPLGSSDEYWEAYLSTAPTVKAQLWRNAKDAIPSDIELLRRWRVVSGAGEVPKKSDYVGFSKPIVEGLIRKWDFLNALVVSEKPAPQAGNDHIFGNRN